MTAWSWINYLCEVTPARLAQSVERRPFKPVVVGSSPTVGNHLEAHHEMELQQYTEIAL